MNTTFVKTTSAIINIKQNFERVIFSFSFQLSYFLSIPHALCGGLFLLLPKDWSNQEHNLVLKD